LRKIYVSKIKKEVRRTWNVETLEGLVKEKFWLQCGKNFCERMLQGKQKLPMD
jgi:hypothetical protein